MAYVSYIPCDEIVKEKARRERKFGRAYGFVAFNGTNFYVIDYGWPQDILDEVFNVFSTHMLTLHPFIYKEQKGIFRIWPDQAWLFVYSDGVFVKYEKN